LPLKEREGIERRRREDRGKKGEGVRRTQLKVGAAPNRGGV